MKAKLGGWSTLVLSTLLAVALAAAPAPRLAAQATVNGVQSGVQVEQLPPQRLVYAVYDGAATATSVFGSIKAAQRAAGGLRGSYAVVRSLDTGRITVTERQAGTLGQTALLSGVVALLGPGNQPKAQKAGENAAQPAAVDSLRAALTPGTSAIVGVVNEPSAEAVAKRLREKNPRSIVNERVMVNPG
ncbi:MAG TPA: hypothetical protein VFW66_09085 [Gemmatimonadales bacterium]|nr:hypothetical protein [Gemmatimonadales bacterium]